MAIVGVVFYAAWAVWAEVYWSRGMDVFEWLAEWRWLNPVITVGLASLALWQLVRKWPFLRRAAI